MLVALCLTAFASAKQDPPRPAGPTRLGTCILQVDDLEEPTAAAFGPNDSLYVCESLKRRVAVLDATGKRVRTIGDETLLDPRDIALAEDGTLIVADAGLSALVLFSPEGLLIRRIGKRGSKPGELLFPEGLDVLGKTIAVADTGNDRVQLFELSGEFKRELGGLGSAEGRFNAPADVAFASDGGWFVADTFNQRIQCFSPAGEFVRAFGTPGPNPGQFACPTGVAMQGGFVHVVDRDNSRVQVFDSKGQLSDGYGIHALRPREGRGKLHYPERVAVNAAGTRAMVVEPIENRVQILGELDLEVPGLPPLPALPPAHFGGAVDADGPLFVLAEPSIPRILLFQMVDGEAIEITRFGTYGSGFGKMLWPNDVAIDLERRRIYVADTGCGRVSVFGFRFDPAEELRFDPERARFVGYLDLERAPWAHADGALRILPQGMWRDGEGGLCLADPRNRAVWRVDVALSKGVRIALPGSCLDPVDGCAAPKPEAPRQAALREQLVVDRLGGSVFELHSGKLVAGGFSRPAAVLSTREGATYVSDTGANALFSLGSERKTIASGAGLGANNLWRPRGLAELAGGRVLVVDWANHRCSIFDRAGKFQRAFGSQLFIRPTFASEAPKTAEPQLALAPPPA
ncbi:MAG: NHL repeat-containing protein, partial [Planctomycetota bacterium]